jgi:hypothetical protein
MPASTPFAEMAETLRVLAGANASNAAHYFTTQCYESGDMASAVLWSGIAHTLDGATPAIQSALDAPVPAPIRAVLEEMAFGNSLFEDAEPEVLAQEDFLLQFNREMTELASDDDFAPAQDELAEDEAARAADLELAEAA